MKPLLTIFTLVFTMMFSSTSFADWTKVTENVNGDTYYVDFERMRKVDGFVYYWTLVDFLKPRNGDLSVKSYNQGDCKQFRYKILSAFLHKEPMGGGRSSYSDNPKNPQWEYPPPKTRIEIILKVVCSR